MPFTDPIIQNPPSNSVFGIAIAANTLYSGSNSFLPGLYTITCVSSTVASVDFFSGSTRIGGASTTAGLVQFNLPTSADGIKFSATVPNTIIQVTLTALRVSNTVAATLYTITANQVNALVGFAYFILVGGGQDGFASPGGSSHLSGAGGRSGNYLYGTVNLVGGEAIVIGARGAAPTDTTLAALTSASGANAPGGAAVGSNTNGNPGSAITAQTSAPFFITGNTGSGGSGGESDGVGNQTGGNGAGSGIGAGGKGGDALLIPGVGNPGAPGTGYGSGGGGGGCFQTISAGAGGLGTPGVCYLLVP